MSEKADDAPRHATERGVRRTRRERIAEKPRAKNSPRQEGRVSPPVAPETPQREVDLSSDKGVPSVSVSLDFVQIKKPPHGATVSGAAVLLEAMCRFAGGAGAGDVQVYRSTAATIDAPTQVTNNITFNYPNLSVTNVPVSMGENILEVRLVSGGQLVAADQVIVTRV